MHIESPDASPDLIDRVLATATPLETPCGDGRTVWHRWGPQSPGALPTVVLLHGGSGSWTHWVRNIQTLVATGRQVLVPDLPGFGDAAPPPPGSHADAVAPVLAEGLQILLQGRPCNLVGLSFGGMVGGMMT
ncbi:MAG: alpha/beta fold hydrolase, partial [Microbacteriaceae bacterium]|nr:alpha/beta fold hydrolase [Burkholderiaceae bacterium]